MYLVKGYTVMDPQLDAWIHTFVLPTEPLFFYGEDLVNYLLGKGILVYTREEFFSSFPDFALLHGGVYNVWSTPSDAYVVFVSGTDLARVTSYTDKVAAQQKDMKRGHVYSREWLERLNERIPGDQSLNSIMENLAPGDDLVLMYRMWSRLSDQVKSCWILQWLDDNLEIPMQEPDRCQFQGLPGETAQILEKYAGRFATYSGANCFAATLAVAVGEMKGADCIIHQWLHPGPFFRLLAARGYKKATEWRSREKMADMQAGDVLVWQNGTGHAVHAAYAIDNSLVFNKMGQSWPQPWQVIQIDRVSYTDVISKGGVINVYRR